MGVYRRGEHLEGVVVLHEQVVADPAENHHHHLRRAIEDRTGQDRTAEGGEGG